MTADVHVLCGPAGSGKTRRLVERFRSASHAVGGALWLGPTQRGVEALREHLFESGAGCLAPWLCTFQDFVEEIIRVNDPLARPLSQVQRRLLIEDLVAELHARGELSHFHRVIDTRGFGEGILALLADLKRQEVWPEQLSQAASTTKDRQCTLLYAGYQEWLSRHHLYDVEGRPWYARDLLRRGLCRPFQEVRAVFVDGFADFTRTQHDILSALSSLVAELWITLPNEPGDERAELWTRPRTTLARLESLRPTVEYLSSGPPLPIGLAHVERQLFRPLRAIEQAPNAEGISLIEAPGLVGETRLVARRIKTLLLEGEVAEDILVTMRDLLPYADLIREVFGDYGIPVDVEGTEPLTRNAAVATLLRALRLPEDNWPFAAVTALLRSNYFAPAWAEANVAQHAEVLLRLLGEPRGRDAYLEAVRRWADKPQPGLEDEQAEESRRQRKHELAVKCRPFLERFFHAWDQAPAKASLIDHVAWLRAFADDLGLTGSATRQPRDATAFRRLWQELDLWCHLDRELHGSTRLLERRAFYRRLLALTAEAGLARTPRGPGRVRVLSAALARGLEASFVFVMGLGERSFPRLAAPEPIFDEQERQTLRQAGVDLARVSDLMPDEMLLFYQVLTRTRQHLVLSYPAVDDKGQALLPSSFLNALLDCFQSNAIPVERRRMLIERYDQDRPLSSAEQRVRIAQALAAGHLIAEGPNQPLSPDLAANLSTAAEVVRQRLRVKEFNPYDGLFRDPGVIANVAQTFGPEKIFSPTALEDYVACPFRFFLRHVLRLEPLEEPREEIEVTRRGQAFHRALSRLHNQLKTEDIDAPTEVVDQYLLSQLGAAVAEYVARAPSPASKELWRLEGQRLMRVALRYRGHWEKFREPWLPLGVTPRPAFFEVDFGLPANNSETPPGPLIIRVHDIEVRISGRIDRVDVAELEDGIGYWIIDYKTGRSSHYTSPDLSAFRRLQLTLYALAVEQVLLDGQNARPLGLAYWLVGEGGPKIALPGRGAITWFNETERWREVRERLQQWVATLAANIRQGAFPLKPRSENCTQTCDFGQICRITQARPVDKPWELPLPS